MKVLGIYFTVINVVTFFLYGLDKWKAKRNAWRISEKMLLLAAFAGGSIGALTGMFFFHHKTRHTSFRVLVPLFLLIHVAVILWLMKG